jgi:hypothetical protein
MNLTSQSINLYFIYLINRVVALPPPQKTVRTTGHVFTNVAGNGSSMESYVTHQVCFIVVAVGNVLEKIGAELVIFNLGLIKWTKAVTPKTTSWECFGESKTGTQARGGAGRLNPSFEGENDTG